MFDPQCAVLVERCDAFCGGYEVRATLVVVTSTNPTIAFLAGPSFHEGNGSVCASSCATKASEATTNTARAD